MTDPRSREAILLAERVAEEGLRERKTSEYARIHNDSVGATRSYPNRSLEYFAAHLAVFALDSKLATHSMLYRILYEMASDPGARALQVRLMDDLFGNPFRAVAFDPAWHTSDVLLLAKGIYEEREFGAMPILADALQDAGCDSADLLDHLRDSQAPHVRGCWALDLVLGKE